MGKKVICWGMVYDMGVDHIAKVTEIDLGRFNFVKKEFLRLLSREFQKTTVASQGNRRQPWKLSSWNKFAILNGKTMVGQEILAGFRLGFGQFNISFPVVWPGSMGLSIHVFAIRCPFVNIL